jgi:hypothetical protein
VTPAEIFVELGKHEGIPVEAVEAARMQRDAMVPVFLRAFEQYLAAGGDDDTKQSLFIAFHLLAEWREQTAYRPLAHFLRSPAACSALGDAVTETSHRVMAAVFDGDPAPLFEIIRDPAADEFIRGRMCDAAAMLTLREEISRDAAALFLRACYFDLAPQNECYVWVGWQRAVAFLGLKDLEPMVKRAFTRRFIASWWLKLSDFQQDLRYALEYPEAPDAEKGMDYQLFGDTIEELSAWGFAEPKTSEGADEPVREWRWAPMTPATNPLKGLGRNNPCPCGSGKKFKKCCLDAERDAAA